VEPSSFHALTDEVFKFWLIYFDVHGGPPFSFIFFRIKYLIRVVTHSQRRARRRRAGLYALRAPSLRLGHPVTIPHARQASKRGVPPQRVKDWTRREPPAGFPHLSPGEGSGLQDGVADRSQTNTGHVTKRGTKTRDLANCRARLSSTSFMFDNAASLSPTRRKRPKNTHPFFPVTTIFPLSSQSPQ